MRPATILLAEFAAGAQPPAAQLSAAARELGRALETGRGRCRSAAAEAALGAAAAYGTGGGGGLIGRPERLPPAWAAFANGVACGQAVVAAGLAGTERLELPVEELLVGLAIGLEAGHRLEAALATAPSRRAWAPGAAAAAVGAAAAAGRLARLDPPRLCAAIALTATQAGGIGGERDGWLTAGMAAFNAVEAVDLAEAGFTAPAAAIEGRRGLAALTAPGAGLSPLLEGLGETWRQDSEGGEPASFDPRRRVRDLLGAL